MKIYCSKNAFITEAVEYTLNYLLNRCGFFFEWTDDEDNIPETGIHLFYGHIQSQLAIKEKSLLLPQYIKPEQLHDLSLEWHEIKLNDKIIPVLKTLESPEISEIDPSLTSFDLLANVYYHLTRIEELKCQHPDQLDQEVEHSILFKNGGFMIPVVDILTEYLKKIILDIAGKNNLLIITKTLYPQAQEFAIALTHDVDFIRAFHPIKKYYYKALIRTGLKNDMTTEEINKCDNDNWGFDQLLPLYKKRKYRATFFFMARNTEGIHFRYNIKNRKIKQLFKMLIKAGHEIAFHPSRYAFEKSGRYKKEKKKLEKRAGVKLSGLRHHYLRCLFPQIWKIAENLGLKYNAGMIHRFYSGFRAGTCFPFPAFDHLNKKQINIIEFPTTFFENTLPEKGDQIEESKRTIGKLLNTIKNQGGLFNILWHSNNINQPENYKLLWRYIINLIKGENAFIKPLDAHHHWYFQRNQLEIKSVNISGNRYTIQFAVPEELSQFCLNAPSGFDYTGSEIFKYDSEKGVLHIKNDNKSGIIIEARKK